MSQRPAVSFRPAPAPHAGAPPEPALRPAPVPGLAPVAVVKFGSSLLKSPADAALAASELYRQVRAGRKVVAVVSALGGQTDRLLAEARALGLDHDNDLLPGYVASGEEKAARLVALACHAIGLEAAALSVRELGLIAEGPLEAAEPIALNRPRLRAALGEHEVVVVPGFAGVRPDGRVALLGRGGSDLSAVFLAAELGCEEVLLCKDVDGLYAADPARAPGAARFERLSFEAALRLGGRVVQPRALELARARSLPIRVARPGGGRATVVGLETAPAALAPAAPRLRIAVAGCGVVGAGVVERVLADDRFELVGVLVRDPAKPRDAALPEGVLTADPQALFDRAPEVIVDALSERDAGHALSLRALKAGIDVASANKQAIAADPSALHAAAAASGARLAYSAAVGGGAMMIETARAARAAGPVRELEAVLNGTVNFLLHRMAEGAPFADALAEARAAGFAEEDPSADLEGFDALAKLNLLALEAFGRAPDRVERVDALSADAPPSPDARQIASLRLDGERLVGEIAIRPAARDLLLGRLKGERNALRLRGEGGVFTCKGRGAGRRPTTESVMADLYDHARARGRI